MEPTYTENRNYGVEKGMTFQMKHEIFLTSNDVNRGTK